MTEITEIPQDSGAATRRIHNSMLSKSMGDAVAVREALLTLLAVEPNYGFRLHTELIRRLPQRSSLNVGQSYSTLERARKAGLIEGAGATEDGLPLFRLTAAGEAVVTAWFDGADGIGSPADETAERVLLRLSLGEAAPAVLPGTTATLAREHSRWQGRATATDAYADPLHDAALTLQREHAAAMRRWIETLQASNPSDFALDLAADRPRRGRPRRNIPREH